MESSFVVANGVHLAYQEWSGERGPILCLPHLTGHKGSFNKLAQALAPAYRVIAVDLRGRGDSSQPADGYGFSYHARDVFALAEALHLDAVMLLGHSFGATTAAYITSIEPQRVRALMLLDGGREPAQTTLRAMFTTIQKLNEVYPSLDAYIKAQRANPIYQPWTGAFQEYFADDVITLSDGAVRAKGSADGIARDMEQHLLYRVQYNLAGITCPTLFLRPGKGLAGDKGHVYPDADADALVASIRHARRRDVAGVNHYSMLIHDQPPVVAPILEFLNELSRGESQESGMGV